MLLSQPEIIDLDRLWLNAVWHTFLPEPMHFGRLGTLGAASLGAWLRNACDDLGKGPAYSCG